MQMGYKSLQMLLLFEKDFITNQIAALVFPITRYLILKVLSYTSIVF